MLGPCRHTVGPAIVCCASLFPAFDSSLACMTKAFTLNKLAVTNLRSDLLRIEIWKRTMVRVRACVCVCACVYARTLTPPPPRPHTHRPSRHRVAARLLLSGVAHAEIPVFPSCCSGARLQRDSALKDSVSAMQRRAQ